MYELIDTFNNRAISRHKSLDTLARAQQRHARAVRKNNGENSYIPYGYRCDRKPLTDSELDSLRDLLVR